MPKTRSIRSAFLNIDTLKYCPRSRIEVRPTALPRPHALDSAVAACVEGVRRVVAAGLGRTGLNIGQLGHGLGPRAFRGPALSKEKKQEICANATA